MKAQVDSRSRGWKDFICREEKRKAAWGACREATGKQWSHGSGWKLCFYSLFVLPEGGGVSQGENRSFLGRRSVSLANYHLLKMIIHLLQSVLQFPD
jgi:hypothetical protein